MQSKIEKKRFYLTGASGFVGQAFLNSDPQNVMNSEVNDLLDIEDVLSCVSKVVDPKSNIVHLAAQSHVGVSFEDPWTTFQVNVTGTHNLIDALKKSGFEGRLLIISSGDIYGKQRQDEMPISEKSEARPLSPYAYSKVMAEFIAETEAKEAKFDVVFARSFNHIGAGQAPGFAISSFAKQLVEISLGIKENKIVVGNLDTYRDFTNVKDIIQAYKLILEKGSSFEKYCVASGESRSIKSLLEILMEITGVNPVIKVDEALLRKSEQTRLQVDVTKLKSLGWEPKYSINETLEEVVEYWRSQLK